MSRLVTEQHDYTPPRESIDYRDGGDGMIKWCEDYIRVPIYPPGEKVARWVSMSDLPDTKHPKTNKTYKYLWEEQKRILREALQMKNGEFIYRLIVLCWMRGEGKSLVAVLIQMWKFFCFPRQQIMLGANSKDQVKFVHYDIMRDIILNSPLLLAAVGKKNIQEKEIRLKVGKNVTSLIRSISSFSGIVSNITGYTFSEIFDMKNPKFFVQLDGSIRNIPNALGVIDSTVSEKTHVLYNLYRSWQEGRTKTLFFHYRFSKLALMEDYWNPNMDNDQLNDYRQKFPFGEFERYFQNLWSSGALRVFTDEQIEETKYMGLDNTLMVHPDVISSIKERQKMLDKIEDMERKGQFDYNATWHEKIAEIDNRLVPVDNYMKMVGAFGVPQMVPVEALHDLGDKLQTDWAIIAGADMGDPVSVKSRARSILTVMAKGLIGSRDKRYEYKKEEIVSPRYIYLLVYLAIIEGDGIEGLKTELDLACEEYDGVDTFCMERYGIGDMENWCLDRGFSIEPVFPNYARQKAAFKELYIAVDDGRFKAPTVPVPGSKENDILREEMAMFDHDSEKKWFGSPEKTEKYGVQDDVMYSSAWCIYGGRMLGPAEFRRREGERSFGVFIPDRTLLGAY